VGKGDTAVPEFCASDHSENTPWEAIAAAVPLQTCFRNCLLPPANPFWWQLLTDIDSFSPCIGFSPFRN
jgi:hypothetical protein